ncbi:hypothetical protein B0H34DRAFT_731754 [Crassisporium funariophilum]|nr:hypothetical protein B0H34DRAFT_731754 [Crassisporium funariophilum]
MASNPAMVNHSGLTFPRAAWPPRSEGKYTQPCTTLGSQVALSNSRHDMTDRRLESEELEAGINATEVDFEAAAEKPLHPPAASVNLDELATSTKLALEVLAPWCKIKHPSSPAVLAICQEIKSYIRAINFSIKASQEGFNLAEEALLLADHLKKPEQEHAGKLKVARQKYAKSIYELAVKGRKMAVESMNKFRDVRQTMNQLIPDAKAAANKEVGFFTRGNACSLHKSLSNLETSIEVLERFFDHVSQYVSWWNRMEMLHGSQESSIETLQFDYNTLRDDVTTNRWKGLRDDYVHYTSKIRAIQDAHASLFAVAVSTDTNNSTSNSLSQSSGSTGTAVHHHHHHHHLSFSKLFHAILPGGGQPSASHHTKSPPDHPSASSYNEGAVAHKQYFHTGDPNDLNSAITHYRHALALRGSGHDDLGAHLVNLAAALWIHYEQNGKPETELAEIISLNEEALRLWLDFHPKPKGSPILLTNLGNAYLDKYRKDMQSKSIDEAISHYESALNLSPPNSDMRKNALIMLGTALWVRCDLGNLKDRLDDAITNLVEALNLCSEDVVKAVCLFNLGNAYNTRYERGKQTEDLDLAIVHYTTAASALPESHVDLPQCRYNLSLALWKRHGIRVSDPREAYRAEMDLEEASRNAAAAFKITSDSELRLKITRIIARIETRQDFSCHPSSPIDYVTIWH